jgi:hypothetical protein
MMRDPMPCNGITATNPHAIMRLDIIKESLQRPHATWPAKQTTMHANGHHPRTRFTFSIKHIEAIFEIAKEVISRVKPLWCCKTHIVCIKRVGHDQM